MVHPMEATTMYVNNGKGFNGHQGHNQGYNVGKGGHSKKERPICTYCGLIGHIADKYYKLYDYPLGYKPKGGNKFMANQVSIVLPSGNIGGQMFLLLQIHTRIMILSLKLLLHHRMFLVFLLVVFLCKLVHRLPYLNVPYLRLNVSSYLIF